MKKIKGCTSKEGPVKDRLVNETSWIIQSATPSRAHDPQIVIYSKLNTAGFPNPDKVVAFLVRVDFPTRSSESRTPPPLAASHLSLEQEYGRINHSVHVCSGCDSNNSISALGILGADHIVKLN